jgi:acyl dehydratase
MTQQPVSVGAKMPPWSRSTHLAEWNRFAAVNDEFIPIHMDDEAAQAAGNPQGAFGMGNLRFAYMANALRDWFGEDTDIREIGCQFRRINQKGDVLSVLGEVIAVAHIDGELEVELKLDVVNQAGESTSPGRAVVRLRSPER